MQQLLLFGFKLVNDSVTESLLTELTEYYKSGKLVWTVIIIAGAIVLWMLIRTLIRRRLKMVEKRSAAERNIRIMANITKIIIGFLTTLLILQVNGINITSLVAGLSLTSVVVGFALQSILADWISGITIMSEHFFAIGDIVKVDGQIGRVINVNLKVTQLEEMDTGNIVSINNRLVVKAEVLSTRLDLDVPVSYEMTVADAAKLMNGLCKDVKKIAGVQDCEVKGIQEFDESIIYHRLRITLDDPIQRWQVRRDVHSLVRERYEESGWSIPYNRMDVRILPEENNKDA